MQDDFFDNFPQSGQPAIEPVYAIGTNNNYEFFEDAPQQNQPAQDGYGSQDTNGARSQSPTKYAQDAYVSPEQLQRREKLRTLEDERIRQVREKEDSERREKSERQSKAQQYLLEWKQQRSQQIAQKNTQNRERQVLLLEARKNQNEYKNSWDKVGSNIALKDGEYPGKKDVGKMRQAILNKKADLNK